MTILKCALLTLGIFLQVSLPAQVSVKEYYKQFPYKFNKQFPFKNGSEDFEVYQDTTCDEKNAYLHIQSKSFRTFSDYMTFTYFKGASGNKIFACEAGFSTTVSDETKTVFYTNKNNKWKDVSAKVFPYKFTFKDFWKGGKLPLKKFQKFDIWVAIPPKGTYVTVHIAGLSSIETEELYTKDTDWDTYDKLFEHAIDGDNNVIESTNFKTITFNWDAKKEIFVRKK
jgi:hypothetical protein